MKDVRKATAIKSNIGSVKTSQDNLPVVISSQEIPLEYGRSEFDVVSRHKAGKGAQVQVRAGKESLVEVPYGSVGMVKSDRVVVTLEEGEEHCVFAYEPEDSIYLDVTISPLTKPQTRLQVGYQFTFSDGQVAVAKPKKVAVIKVGLDEY